MPEISVIIPIYNAESFLRESIGSVLSQSFSDWELILVDDGSSDGSNRICREYVASDSRIRLLRKENGGLSSARNAGLDVVSGRYITFLDADDELYPDALEALYSHAEGKGLGMVIGKSINSVSRPEGMKGLGKMTVFDSEALCRAMLYRVPHPSTSACGRIYRRELFDGIRFYNGMYEDLEIFHKLVLRAGRVGVIDKPVYFYRDNPGSFINTWSDRRKDAVKVTQMIADTYADDPLLYKAALNRQFRANFNLLLTLLQYRPEDKESIEACYSKIKQLRGGVLCDSFSLLSTRVGAVISYLGLGLLRRSLPLLRRLNPPRP